MAARRSPLPGSPDHGEQPEQHKPSGKEVIHHGGEVINIQKKTQSNALAAQKKSSEARDSRMKKKMDGFFRWGLLVSFLAHSPLIFGRSNEKFSWNEMPDLWGGLGTGKGFGTPGEEKKDDKENPKIQDETPPKWEEEVRESLEKEIGKKEAEEVIGEVDPDALAGFKKAQEAIKERQAERAARVDKAKLEEYKKQLLDRIEKGEKVLFRDFVFELELLGLGIDPKDIETAKKVFMDEMHELEKSKPEVPTREFLQKIVSYTEAEDKDKNNNGTAYEPTRTSLAEYLVRKKQGKRGNCKARGKYQAMALEYLYPERRKDILLQKGGDHIRTLFQVGENLYDMEPGVAIVDKESLKGTITFTLDEYMLSSAGKKIVKHVDEDKQKPNKADLPTINDDNGVFVEPQADGKLKNFSDNHQFLYKEKFTPPETQKMKLPPTSKEVHEQNEKIRKEEAAERQRKAMEENNAKYQRNVDRAKKLAEAPPVTSDIMESAEWVEVPKEGTQPNPEGVYKQEDVAEILPWKQKDYPEIELTDRIHGEWFNGGPVVVGMDRDKFGNRTFKEIPGLTNPSPETIKKINSYALKSLTYHDHALYGSKTWHEIFNTGIPQISFTMDAANLSMDFENLLASDKDNTARNYKGELALFIKPYSDSSGSKTEMNASTRDSTYTPYQEFPERQFRLLMQGEGGLKLTYSERDFSEKEIEMIAQSSRPYVMIDGYVCNFKAGALSKMRDSKKTVLVLSDQIYFEVIHRIPGLLDEPNAQHVKSATEYFFQDPSRSMFLNEHPLLNAYHLREVLTARQQAAGPSGPARQQSDNELGKLNELIQMLETAVANTYATNPDAGVAYLQDIQQKARMNYENTHYDGPIGCMGMCMPPDSMDPYYVAGGSGNIVKYQKPSEQTGNIPEGKTSLNITQPNGDRYNVSYGTLPGTFILRMQNSSGSTTRPTVFKDSDGSYYFKGGLGEKIPLTPKEADIVRMLDK